MATPRCALCGGEAEVIKYERETMYDADDNETYKKIPLKICRHCAEDWYDGTEAYPGTHPL